MNKIISWLISIILIVGILYWVVDINICDDGTISDNCSKSKPFYCSKGILVEDVKACGCPWGYEDINNKCEKKKSCSEGTFYNVCSIPAPIYCENGSLIEKSSECGCPDNEVRKGEGCISMYETYPKSIILPEVGGFLVYGGLNNYLDDIPDTISYYEDERPPTNEDFILKDIDNEIQGKYLKPIVEIIKNMSSDKEEQGRITIRMVQKIPYDDYAVSINELEGRLPYEVIYDMTGVCGSKSQLLAYILRELGIGVAILEFEKENHRAVGIKCSGCDYENSGYCFIESTVSSIPTDSEGDYVETGSLSRPSEIIVISDGLSLDFSKECKDANDFNILLNKGKYLSKRDYAWWFRLVDEYELEIEDE